MLDKIFRKKFYSITKSHLIIFLIKKKETDNRSVTKEELDKDDSSYENVSTSRIHEELSELKKRKVVKPKKTNDDDENSDDEDSDDEDSDEDSDDDSDDDSSDDCEDNTKKNQ